MFERNLFTKNALVTTALTALTVVSMSSCSKHGSTSSVTPQGTVQLDALKVGQPEATFKDASLTFVTDTKAAATSGGKTQYVSRSYNPKGGQYVANCKDAKCFVLQVLYVTNPIAKEDALGTLKTLMPADAVQSKVDDSLLASKNIEIYDFGDKYTGTLEFTGKDAANVKTVSAMDMKPAEVLALLSGKPGKAKPESKGKTATKKGGKVTAPKESASTETTTTTAATH